MVLYRAVGIRRSHSQLPHLSQGLPGSEYYHHHRDSVFDVAGTI